MNLDNFVWKKIEHDNLFPRYWHCSLISDNHEMFIHGGWNVDNLNDFMSVKLPILKKSMNDILVISMNENIFSDILVKIQN